MSPTGIDQSWGYADPAAAARAGVQVVSMYLSHDPSKNVTAAKVRAYHAHGIGVLLNWESDAGRPLLGASAGDSDARDAVALVQSLIRAVGYAPKSKLAIAFSCDRDVNSSQYAAIDGYYRSTKRVVEAVGYLNGVYGEADLVAHLHAAGLTSMEWQTLAWSGGRVDPQADFYQSSINDTLGGASVDFDQVLHAVELGAWWPPNHPLNGGAMALDATDKTWLLNTFLPALVRSVWSATYTKNGVATSMQNWCASADMYAGQAAVASQAVQKQLASNGGPVTVSPQEITLSIGVKP